MGGRPSQVPVLVSKLDVSYAYNCGMLRTSHAGTFAYIISLAAGNYCIIICVNIVLPIRWVDSPKFFCKFSETLTNVANALIHTSLPVPGCGAIYKISKTGAGTPHSLDSLNHIYWYMDDVVTAVQSGTEQQRQVFDVTAWSLKWLFPSLPGEKKDLVRMKKLLLG